MTVSRDMTPLETEVLNIILNKGSLSAPLPAKVIREKFNLSKRKLENVVESLRVNFRHPIVSQKRQPSGYYLPRSEEERQAGLAPYKRQILTEQKNIAIVQSIDLVDYWEGMMEVS